MGRKSSSTRELKYQNPTMANSGRPQKKAQQLKNLQYNHD
ncbi:hypothetical protein PanWU01x14_342690 [Parasponia andersonii]|uniref:Uncharacterized protein n=1 Tax=Parasponia andersonii TaxID=3476 RepID=A0A2P5ADM8_PARAD|nr:hypothetical protein PanWU01x14_342690 [Parasponia andersonii]